MQEPFCEQTQFRKLRRLYCTGPNHVLPTAISTRFPSPLGVLYDFQKRTSLISVSPAGSRYLGDIASYLAQCARRESAKIRNQ